LKILTFTSLYPSAARPNYARFVETRLLELVGSGAVEAVVVAPVPWFPSGHPRFGRYAAFARTPREETRAGIRVLHPRFPALPGLGKSIVPILMAAGALPAARALRRAGFDFEAIDAHYFYPDGAAAAILGAMLERPVVITARGTDLNVFARQGASRRWISWAARRAAAVVTVSEALRQVALGVGMEARKLHVLRNGVDLVRFRPIDRADRRRALGLDGLVVATVGNLVNEKGHDLAVQALAQLPGATLLVVGEGPSRTALEALAQANGVGDRVRFLGAIAQEELAKVYGAADVLVLGSEREGWPNVLLEAMACGTPVVAAAVGGCPEIVAAPEAGLLLEARTADAVARAIGKVVAANVDRAATRRYAERFGWAETTAGQLGIFRGLLGHTGSGSGAQARSVH
jgi:teichuronic acid biosynthesis glycosyltransferase TuaC